MKWFRDLEEWTETLLKIHYQNFGGHCLLKYLWSRNLCFSCWRGSRKENISWNCGNQDVLAGSRKIKYGQFNRSRGSEKVGSGFEICEARLEKWRARQSFGLLKVQSQELQHAAAHNRSILSISLQRLLVPSPCPRSCMLESAAHSVMMLGPQHGADVCRSRTSWSLCLWRLPRKVWSIVCISCLFLSSCERRGFPSSDKISGMLLLFHSFSLIQSKNKIRIQVTSSASSYILMCQSFEVGSLVFDDFDFANRDGSRYVLHIVVCNSNYSLSAHQ